MLSWTPPHCPDCARELVQRASVEVDICAATEDTWSWWACPSCPRRFYVEMQDHLATWDEAFTAQVYAADPAAWDAALAEVRATCPDPDDAGCGCDLHADLADGGLPGRGEMVPWADLEGPEEEA